MKKKTRQRSVQQLARDGKSLPTVSPPGDGQRPARGGREREIAANVKSALEYLNDDHTTNNQWRMGALASQNLDYARKYLRNLFRRERAR